MILQLMQLGIQSETHCTKITDIPAEVAGTILARVPPKQVWKLRELSKAFRALIETESFARLNLSHFLPNRSSTLAHSFVPIECELIYFTSSLQYQRAFVQSQWKSLTRMQWHNEYRALSGISIPVALLGCKSLVILTLYRCGLQGPIPAEIGSALASLQTLNLSDNQLIGEIPPSIGLLKCLKVLVLDENKLSGGIPVELSALACLELLSLSSNHDLCAHLPPQLGLLKNLKSLYISCTNVSGSIPMAWGGLAKLARLFLDYNPGLSGTIPPAIGNLSLLKCLSFKACELTGSIPPELGRLANLERIYLQGNKLSGEVPVEWADLGHLSECILMDNFDLTCSVEFRENVNFRI
ncbi:hypothetical protein HDU98_009564 [Podochytrium sp. JEL0797]|nr:hypothetical protein HDU98_009564 [Podochytrium sp. JEL0797]